MAKQILSQQEKIKKYGRLVDILLAGERKRVGIFRAFKREANHFGAPMAEFGIDKSAACCCGRDTPVSEAAGSKALRYESET